MSSSSEKETTTIRDDTPALTRGLALLELLANSRQGIGSGELLRRCALPRASLFRMLTTLQRHGMIAQDQATGLYRLGRRTMMLGYLARRHDPLNQAAQPVLRALADQGEAMSELVTLAEPWRLLMLDTWPCGKTPLNVIARSGMFFDLVHTHAYGLCYLAFDGGHALSRYRQRAVSRTAPEDLVERCAAYRAEEGVLFHQPEPNRVVRLAMPLFDPRSRDRRLLACLGLVCEAREMNSARAHRWRVLMRAAVKSLEAEPQSAVQG